MSDVRQPMKRAHDLATVQTVFMLIKGALSDFEKRLAAAGVHLPEDCSTNTEHTKNSEHTGTPCE